MNHHTPYEYFEQVARYHPDLLHDPATRITFARSISEANDLQRNSKVKWPMLICIGYDWKYQNSPDALIRKVDFELWVIGKAKGSTDWAGMHAVWAQTLQIVEKIVGRMQADARSYTPSIVSNLLADQVEGEQIGPVLDLGYGHSLKVPLKPTRHITFDNAEWGGYSL